MTTVTISTETWQGRLGMGLAPRELEATLHAASDLTAKEIAKLMGIAPGTVSKRLDDARFKLGAKTIRGLVLDCAQRPTSAMATTGRHSALSPGTSRAWARRSTSLPWQT